ncbi:MAG: hypothetical protein OXB94_05885 [Nitrospira sp.]|nr:hypothetical protein [Nitrospira sp.]
MKSKPKPKKPSKPKRPRGRPTKYVIEPIDATPEDLARSVFRVADEERDRRLEKPR